MRPDSTSVGVVAVFTLCLASLQGGAGAELTLYVSPAKSAATNVPVHAAVRLPPDLANLPAEQVRVTLERVGALRAAPVHEGQLVAGPAGGAQLWWILPHVGPHSSSMWLATFERRKGTEKQGFRWTDHARKHLDLSLNDRTIARYMYAYDTSTAQKVYETQKPFHHVFAADGTLLTNGPDGVNPFPRGKGMSYHHHRGILTGWHLAHEGKEYNFWGMEDGVSMKHQDFLELVAGPVLARSGSVVHWNDKENRTVVREQRHFTAFRTSDPSILLAEYHVVLEPAEGEMFLIADREHGGLHYRAHNDVAASPPKSEGKAVFLLPDEGSDAQVDFDLPWAAMTYGLRGRWYTVQLMNSSTNPKPTLFSAYRDYGRLGASTQVRVRKGQPLTLRYRLWIAEGNLLSREAYAGQYDAFTHPPEVRVYSESSDRIGRMPWPEKYQ